MAIRHAQPGDVIDVRPLGPALTSTKTTTLFKTESLEVIRIVLPPGKEISEHRAPGEIVVQCLEGDITLAALEKSVELQAGELLYLKAREPHSVKSANGASMLLTISF